jgi:hypothetical protein
MHRAFPLLHVRIEQGQVKMRQYIAALTGRFIGSDCLLIPFSFQCDRQIKKDLATPRIKLRY